MQSPALELDVESVKTHPDVIVVRIYSSVHWNHRGETDLLAPIGKRITGIEDVTAVSKMEGSTIILMIDPDQTNSTDKQVAGTFKRLLREDMEKLSGADLTLYTQRTDHAAEFDQMMEGETTVHSES